MRMIYCGAAFAAAGLLMAACSDAPTGAAPETEEATLQQQVAALGFRGDMIEDHGEYVLVEGDIMLSREQLRSTSVRTSTDPRHPNYQYRTNALVSAAKVGDIRVDVSGLASQTAWQTAAREALTHWSGISQSSVRLVESGPADITVATTCTSYNVAAFASFPSGGNPGSTVYVNTCFGYSTSHAQKVHNMVHELGHTLGFRHSNYAQQGEGAGAEGAVHIYGTPTSSNATGSVMNGGTALNSWAGFATSDLTAVRTLYPLASPSFGVTNSGGYPLLSWTAVPGATSYTVTLITYNAVNGQYQNRGFTVLENTTGTSYLDTLNEWTGEYACTSTEYDPLYGGQYSRWYEYAVQANYPGGSSPIDNSRLYAYIARTGCW